MPATKSGIYHNLMESKYVVSNSEITFFFSSDLYASKFLCTYKSNRAHFITKITPTELNMDTLADIELYKRIEKRGFFARMQRAKITRDDLDKYAIRKMLDKKSLDWHRIER